MQKFSIIDAADQQFGTIVSGRRMTIRVRYNPSSDRWSFDLSLDDQPVLQGRRIVTGADLLDAVRVPFIRKFSFDIGSLFAVSAKAGSAPDCQALPSGGVELIYFSKEEIQALRGKS